jgi:hypothetical protein
MYVLSAYVYYVRGSVSISQIGESLLWKDVGENNPTLDRTSRHVHEGSEETHEHHQVRNPVSKPSFEYRTHWSPLI